MSGETRPPVAWVLNLDAEEELRRPTGYTRSRATQQQIRKSEQTLRQVGLVRAGDVVIDSQGGEGARGVAGRAWCPTPRALARLQAAGAEVPPAPNLAVLQRVNDRRFALELGVVTGLGSVYLREVDGIRELASAGGPWLLKRTFSFAGRGHRRILGPWQDDDARWCHNATREGWGVVVEPLVERLVDFSLHARLTREGELHVGRALVQHCDARGNWTESKPEPAAGTKRLDAEERAALRHAVEAAGQALAAAGYWGPFGIDAFRYRREGQVRFNPMCELNARYSMGWALAGLV